MTLFHGRIDIQFSKIKFHIHIPRKKLLNFWIWIYTFNWNTLWKNLYFYIYLKGKYKITFWIGFWRVFWYQHQNAIWKCQSGHRCHLLRCWYGHCLQSVWNRIRKSSSNQKLGKLSKVQFTDIIPAKIWKTTWRRS